ncbi:S8 family serine peptidase, partial [Methanolobus psychrotolerans]|uniref:S8 family serine peptidase n=1 Tax=Methanolobus psychrotolerans TaxID=1874706 RepID=UPI0013ED4499
MNHKYRLIFILAVLLLVSSQTAYGETINVLEEVKDYVHTTEADYYNLLGNGIKIGVWETDDNDEKSSEINSTRSELSGRVFIIEDYTNVSSHATNVALILASNNVNLYSGMAPDVELYSYDIDENMENELSSSLMDISTNSFGHKSNVNVYTTSFDSESCSEYYDAAIRDAGIIAFKSAGNKNSNSNNYSIITSPGTAKNIITVGAVKEDDFSDTAYFSSYGPCEDGRLKPEIVAPGYNLKVDSNSDLIKGTSYATPVVSGSAALILEEWKNTHSNE